MCPQRPQGPQFSKEGSRAQREASSRPLPGALNALPRAKLPAPPLQTQGRLQCRKCHHLPANNPGADGRLPSKGMNHPRCHAPESITLFLQPLPPRAAFMAHVTGILICLPPPWDQGPWVLSKAGVGNGKSIELESGGRESLPGSHGLRLTV